jgi:cytochrome b
MNASTSSLAGTPARAPGAAAASHSTAARGRRVTDAPTRLFHLLFASSFALAWATGDSEQWRALHVTLGYIMVGLLGFRFVYGLVGPRPARWSSLVARLSGARAWWSQAKAGLRRGEVPWRQGQNVFMAAVVAALPLLLVPLALSGYATYAEWGGDWLEEVHEAFANAMLALVLVHLGLLALLGALRRQNVAAPMLSGRVAGAGPDLVPSQRYGLAVLLLVVVIAFVAWRWSESPHGLLPSAANAAEASVEDDDD